MVFYLLVTADEKADMNLLLSLIQISYPRLTLEISRIFSSTKCHALSVFYNLRVSFTYSPRPLWGLFKMQTYFFNSGKRASIIYLIIFPLFHFFHSVFLKFSWMDVGPLYLLLFFHIIFLFIPFLHVLIYFLSYLILISPIRELYS